MPKIILASASPRRKELLEKLGLAFEIAPSNYEEDMSLETEPTELAKRLSEGKAEDVASRHKDHVVIAADTFVALGKELLGKPHTFDKAKEMLVKISGQTVSVITGYTVIDTASGKKASRAIETKVYIKQLSDSEIDAYAKSGEPLDKAGAFGMQGLGAVIVEKIEGDYANVIGLPLFALSETLKEFGIHVL